MIAVIDDSILGGRSYSGVRDFIRARFVVRAVISLPGDAFQRSKARVKTSLVIFEKKKNRSDVQPDVFMYYCTAVGLDDSPRQRSLPSDLADRMRAEAEIEAVVAAFEAFSRGEQGTQWIVPARAIADRLDVKSCLVNPYRNVEQWKKDGFDVLRFSSWVDVQYPTAEEDGANERMLETADSEELVTLLSIKYAGFAEAGAEIRAADSTYSRLYRVTEDDIVISNINAVHGAVAIVPGDLAGCYVTPEYTVCRAKKGVSPLVVWALLRSPEARANLLLLSTGIGRSRISAEAVLSLALPKPTPEAAESVAASLKLADDLEQQLFALRADAIRQFETALGITSSEALAIMAAFKPPR